MTTQEAKNLVFLAYALANLPDSELVAQDPDDLEALVQHIATLQAKLADVKFRLVCAARGTHFARDPTSDSVV